jgi:hypothetical protein
MTAEQARDMPSIHLQGIGLCNAKPAAELQIGDKTVWNYGSIATVESVRHKGQSVYVSLRDNKRLYPERRFLASRLVAFIKAA